MEDIAPAKFGVPRDQCMNGNRDKEGEGEGGGKKNT